MSGCGADPPFVRGEWTEFKSGRLGCKLNTPSRTMPTSNMSNRRDQERIFIEHQRRTKQRFAGSKLRQRPYLFVLMASAALILLALLVSAVQSTIPMCQYHRASSSSNSSSSSSNHHSIRTSFKRCSHKFIRHRALIISRNNQDKI